MNLDRGRDRGFSTAMRRDEGLCLYCGAEADCVDHIIPWSYARNNDLSNLASACTPCNLAASDFLFDDFTDKAFFILRRRGLLFGFETTEGTFINATPPSDSLSAEDEALAEKERARTEEERAWQAERGREWCPTCSFWCRPDHGECVTPREREMREVARRLRVKLEREEAFRKLVER